VPLVVGNAPPQIWFESPKEGDFFTPGKPISYKVHVLDLEDGDSTQFGELMETRNFVTAQWIRGDGKEEAGHPGLALMKQSDCFNCHAVETKIVGPAYLDVANKYRGQTAAVEASVQRVIKGSAGVWGSTAMLPHEAFTADQVHLMLEWVFGLKPGETGADLVRGLSGKVSAPADTNVHQAILEASYTDAGRSPASPLVGKTRLKLRSRRLEAERADVINGPKVSQNDQAGGRQALTGIMASHTVRFDHLNLSDSASVTCRVANGVTNAVIELHDGSPQGDLLAALPITEAASSNKWVELTAPLKATTRRVDVCLAFTGSGTNHLMNLDWVQFNPRSSSGQSELDLRSISVGMTREQVRGALTNSCLVTSASRPATGWSGKISPPAGRSAVRFEFAHPGSTVEACDVYWVGHTKAPNTFYGIWLNYFYFDRDDNLVGFERLVRD
jgi:cytochrome c